MHPLIFNLEIQKQFILSNYNWYLRILCLRNRFNQFSKWKFWLSLVEIYIAHKIGVNTNDFADLFSQNHLDKKIVVEVYFPLFSVQSLNFLIQSLYVMNGLSEKFTSSTIGLI